MIKENKKYLIWLLKSRIRILKYSHDYPASRNELIQAEKILKDLQVN